MMERKNDQRWKLVQKQNGFVSVCTICGFPITEMELALHIQDAYGTDFITHGEIELTLDACPECRARIIANAKGGMKKAVERFEQLMVMETDHYGKNKDS